MSNLVLPSERINKDQVTLVKPQHPVFPAQWFAGF